MLSASVTYDCRRRCLTAFTCVQTRVCKHAFTVLNALSPRNTNTVLVVVLYRVPMPLLRLVAQAIGVPGPDDEAECGCLACILNTGSYAWTVSGVAAVAVERSSTGHRQVGETTSGCADGGCREHAENASGCCSHAMLKTSRTLAWAKDAEAHQAIPAGHGWPARLVGTERTCQSR